MSAEARLAELKLSLPPEPIVPPQVSIPFQWVRVAGGRIMVSGHGPLDSEGKPSGPFGRVPDEVSLEEAERSAQATGLAMLSAIRRAVGSLDSVGAWLSISGYVQAQAGYAFTTAVLNPLSDLVVEVFGREIGSHARTAIGVSALPLNLPVVVAAELLLNDQRLEPSPV